MKTISIWKDTCEIPSYPTLKENIKTDVLIIGGGMTGISTLYHLRNSKLKTILVEQNRIGQSITGNSTGKLNYLQNNLLDKISANFKDEKASLYLKSQIDAIYEIVNTVKKEKIDCNLEKTDAIVYTNNEEEISKIKDLQSFLNNNGIKTEETNLPLVKYKYMIKASNTYIFHPLKFLKGLLKNSIIYEHTSIIKIDKESDYYICKTNDCQIKAKYIVIASHYPYFNLPFVFPLKGYLEKSYLSASLYQSTPLSLISYAMPCVSMRTYENYLIYLSNSHTSSKDIQDEKHFLELTKKIEDLHLKPKYLWSNIDIMTNDGLPYIGRLKDNIYIGTGYNTWGLTNGFLAGHIISDLIQGKPNKYENLFSPHRLNISQITGGINDMVNSIEGYINGMNKNKNITYENINGKDIMTYKENGYSYSVYHACPHMGCKLLFNEVEKTWDCPCHASRFSLDGKVISGPANKDITYIKKDD